MADITDVIRRIIIQAETLGMDQAASDIRNLASATGSFAQAGAQMGAALGVTETKVTSLRSRFGNISNAVEPVRRDIKALTRDLKDLDLIMAQRQKLNLSVTEVTKVRDLRVEQFDAAQRAVAEKAALTEIALQGRVDAAMAQYAAQRKARAQEVADFEIAQHARANEEVLRRTAGVGVTPTLTDPRAIADQEQAHKHMLSSLAAQGAAYEATAAAAARAANEEVAAIARVDAALLKSASLRVQKAEEIASFEARQTAKANDEFMRRTAGVGVAPTLTDPRAIADQEQINRHMLSSITAQGAAYEQRAAMAAGATQKEMASASALDSAMASYAEKAKKRAADQVAYEERIAQARQQQQSAEFGRSFRERVGVERPPATAGGATFSALAEREAAAEKAEAAATREAAEALKVKAQAYAQLVRLAAELRQQVTPQEEAGSRHQENIANYKKMLDLRLIGEHQYQAAVKQSEAVTAGQSKGVGQTAQAFQNLSFQINDVISGLAMGQAPLTVLTQQAGQFYQVFSSLGGGGGVVGGLKEAVRWLGSLFTVGRVAFGGVTGGAVLAAAAANSYVKAQKESLVALAGVGRGAGMTVDSLESVATASAAAGHISVSSAREMAQAYAATGQVGGEVMPDLIRITKDYAATTKQDIGSAKTELAAAFKDPAKGAEDLNAKLGILNAGQIKTIQNLVAQGRVTEAQKLLMASTSQGIIKAEDTLTVYGRAWEFVTKAASEAYTAIGKAVAGPTTGPSTATEELKKIQEEAKRTQQAYEDVAAARNRAVTEPPRTPAQNDPRGRTQATGASYAEFAAEDARRQNQLRLRQGEVPGQDRQAFAQEKARREQQLVFAQQLTQEINRASKESERLTEQIVPAAKAFDDTNNAAANLAMTLKNMEINPSLVSNVGATRKALQGIRARQADQATVPPELMDEAKREINYQTQIAQITALTDAERVRAAQMASNAAAFDTTLTLQERLANAERAGNLVKTQSAAQTQQQTFVMQQQLNMSSELIAAAQMQGLEGVRVNAMLQAQIALMQQGKSTTDEYAQANIAAAGAQAVLATQLRDVAQATEMRAASQDQLMVIGAETAAIGQNIMARTRLTVIAQAEAQARALERQGYLESAKAVRDYAGALADAKGRQEQAAAAFAITQGQQTEIENVKLEIELMGKSSQARAEATEALKAEQQIRQAGISIYSAEAAAIRRNAEELGRLRGELARKQEMDRENAAAVDTTGVRGGRIPGGSIAGVIRYGALGDTAGDERRAQAEREPQIFQRQMQMANDALSKQIAALNQQRSDIEQQDTASRDAARERLEKLESQAKAIDRPDPYLERNADIFFRKGTGAFRENDPLQKLISEAQAQVAATKDGTTAQVRAIDDQIKALEQQQEKLTDMSELMSAGVDVSREEVQGIYSLISVVRNELPASLAERMGRMIGATRYPEEPERLSGQQLLAKGIDLAMPSAAGRNVGAFAPAPAISRGYAGMFASGGMIPAGSWGIAGEAGMEVIDRPTPVRGPATVTPVSRQIVVNQTIVAAGGPKQLRESRGEIAQRSAANLRREMSRS